jgi:hypothetical protein
MMKRMKMKREMRNREKEEGGEVQRGGHEVGQKG